MKRRPGCTYMDLGVAYEDGPQGSPVTILHSRSPDNDLYLRVPHVRSIVAASLAHGWSRNVSEMLAMTQIDNPQRAWDEKGRRRKQCNRSCNGVCS